MLSLAARRLSPLQLAAASRVPARGMAGAIKVHDCDIQAYDGPGKVERTEPLHEMGVLYQAGVPSPMESTHAIDVIVVDGPSPARASLVATYLPLLNDNGVLFTVEPDMPTGDVAEDDVEGMAMVNGFNRWIELVGETQSTHHVAFMPLFGGTLVAWLPHA